MALTFSSEEASSEIDLKSEIARVANDLEEKFQSVEYINVTTVPGIIGIDETDRKRYLVQRSDGTVVAVDIWRDGGDDVNIRCDHCDYVYLTNENCYVCCGQRFFRAEALCAREGAFMMYSDGDWIECWGSNAEEDRGIFAEVLRNIEGYINGSLCNSSARRSVDIVDNDLYRECLGIAEKVKATRGTSYVNNSILGQNEVVVYSGFFTDKVLVFEYVENTLVSVRIFIGERSVGDSGIGNWFYDCCSGKLVYNGLFWKINGNVKEENWVSGRSGGKVIESVFKVHLDEVADEAVHDVVEAARLVMRGLV